MCRAYLSPGFNQENEEVYIGRNNIGAVSLNLPKLAMETCAEFLDNSWVIADDNLFKEFLKKIDKYSEMAFNIHNDYFKKIGKVKGSSNPLYFCEGGAWMSVGYDEIVEPIYANSTASLGFIGLNEALNALNIFGKDREGYAIKIAKHLKKNTETASEKYNRLFALYSTPAESLCYRFQNINKKDFGIIDGVTDRDYMTNSFHVPVWEDISVPEKIDIEAPFHKISTGGRISYNEFVNGADTAVLKQAVSYAMSKGMYYGVNIVSATCEDCSNSGDFHDKCPVCESTNLTVVTRVCGYLSFDQVKGDSRYNKGKQKEIKERIKHRTA